VEENNRGEGGRKRAKFFGRREEYLEKKSVDLGLEQKKR